MIRQYSSWLVPVIVLMMACAVANAASKASADAPMPTPGDMKSTWSQYFTDAGPDQLESRGKRFVDAARSATAAWEEQQKAELEATLQRFQAALTLWSEAEAADTKALPVLPVRVESVADELDSLASMAASLELELRQTRLDGEEAERAVKGLTRSLDRQWRDYRSTEEDAQPHYLRGLRIMITRLVRDSRKQTAKRLSQREPQLIELLKELEQRSREAVENARIPQATLDELGRRADALEERYRPRALAIAQAELDAVLGGENEAVDSDLRLAVVDEAALLAARAQLMTLREINGVAGAAQTDDVLELRSRLQRLEKQLDRVDDVEASRQDALRAGYWLNLLESMSQLRAGALVRAKSWLIQVGEAFNYTLFTLGDSPVTAGMVLRAIIIILIGFFISSMWQRVLGRAGRSKYGLNPSNVYTLGRLSHYVLIVIALVVALNSIGMEMGNLALIAGALSVGIGFGLQAIVSNFVSGLIILLDRSLKVGDFIELDSGLRGKVREIRVRSTLLTSNDNVDYIVPNSEFVNGKVTNWTYGDQSRRIHVPFGVAYGTDKELVRKAALEAAAEVRFTMSKAPGQPPQVWLVGFGDSSLDFELVLWVGPEGIDRPAGTTAAYNWAIESALGRYGIEIPFPQRDLHVRSDFRKQRLEEPEAA